MEISLKQHLANLGWGARYLILGGVFARITVRNFPGYDSYYVPPSRWRRIFSRKFLSLSDVFPCGTRIKFLKSITEDSYESSLLVTWLIKISCFFKGIDSKEVLSSPVFQGCVEGYDNAPFSEFPWEKYVTVIGTGTFSITFEEESGRRWDISQIALIFVTHIQILVGDIPGMYQPFIEPTDPESQYERGYQYYWGYGGALRSERQAMKWYLLAAEQGHAQAQYEIGTAFYFGRFLVERDYQEAAKWYQMAADQNDRFAQNALCRMYARGEGVPQNDITGYMWASLVLDEGYNPDATETRKELEERMTPDQIAEAQRLAREWRPQGE